MPTEAEGERAAPPPPSNVALTAPAPSLVAGEAPATAAEPAPLVPRPRAPEHLVPLKVSIPPRQSMSTWANDFVRKACACTTRTCVGELQAQFLATLASSEYEEQRDSAAYHDAASEAIRCYFALPAGS